MAQARGNLCLTLHAHLPYVRHPEHPEFLEESWLFEAICETYVPLLLALDRLEKDGVHARLTMNVSPPLAAMLHDALLKARYKQHQDRLLALLEQETRRYSSDDPRRSIAADQLATLTAGRDALFGRYQGEVIPWLCRHRDLGTLELITCTATHGLLPVIAGERARRRQIAVGAQAFETRFGQRPRGIWLAECGYDDGVDRLLAEEGIEFFFIEAQGVLLAEPRPAYGLYAPVLTAAGVAALPRDPESGRQVWSAKEGYPGDPCYREFYKDLGYEGDYETVKPYLHADGVRRSIGVKYHRVTGDVALHQKELYDPAVARERARTHARDFVDKRARQIESLASRMDRPPLITAPYDAELYGHWWYEGPWFLEQVFRAIAERPTDLASITPSEELMARPTAQVVELNPTTWGADSNLSVWVNERNAWMLRHAQWAERTLERLEQQPVDGELGRRALVQAQREVLLAESSDWPFIVTSDTTVPYAVRRFREHLDRFSRLADMLEHRRVDERELARIEQQDPIFEWLGGASPRPDGVTPA